MRDLNAVISKFRHVLNPKQKNNMLKEWDLWGPLLLCTTMATILQTSYQEDKNADSGGPEFAEVFLIVWFGAGIVTLNSKLLGGQISFFQSVCVLGYCLTPLALSLICCKIILILFTQTGFFFFLRIVISMLGFLWATYASVMFMGDSQPPKRKALVIYPMFLFYFVISWLVASHTN
ncbi:hypothetical protein ACKWTF_007289 [Chironomus riparius]